MAAGAPYERQLREAAALVQRRAGVTGEPVLVFQSRSGPPSQPWLGPDIGDYLRTTEAKRVIVAPIGFLSDHMEVVYDLDVEAAALAREHGIEMVRAGTVGTHPKFVAGLAELIRECEARGVAACAADCCPPPVRR
jgi:ferrochelatase